MHNFLLIDMVEHNVINTNRSSLDLKSITGKAAFHQYYDYDTRGLCITFLIPGRLHMHMSITLWPNDIGGVENRNTTAGYSTSAASITSRSTQTSAMHNWYFKIYLKARPPMGLF